jgi:SpoVK/Ycf46/Vps4 family AAA+-type ATPase
LQRIRDYGGRARRGLLLTGPPGNGKTSACRWLWQECRRRRWDWRLVSPDAYAQARRGHNAEQAVRRLFEVQRRGIVFFDDLDLALRDRELAPGSDDQAVFLGALDGINVKEGVVFVFTTNCPLDLIDPAFKRPGRIDVVLEFPPPDEALRRQLMERWHAEIRSHLDWPRALAATRDFSFAELDELKNLLIVHFMDAGCWDLDAALRMLDFNRRDLGADWRRRTIGFAAYIGGCNGDDVESA